MDLHFLKLSFQSNIVTGTKIGGQISVLWQVRQEVGAMAAEKRAARYNKSADEATMTQLDWVTAKRPLKRIQTRMANMPIPFLIMIGREKDQYKEATNEGKKELVKVGLEADVIKGLQYDVNLSLHFGVDDKGWWAQVDKVQGILGNKLPLNGVMREFPQKLLMEHVSQVVQAGDLKDDAEVAASNLQEEEVDKYPRTMAGFVQWSLDTYGMDGKAVGAVLGAAEIKSFDPANWDKMVQVVSNASVKLNQPGRFPISETSPVLFNEVNDGYILEMFSRGDCNMGSWRDLLTCYQANR